MVPPITTFRMPSVDDTVNEPVVVSLVSGAEVRPCSNTVPSGPVACAVTTEEPSFAPVTVMLSFAGLGSPSASCMV